MMVKLTQTELKELELGWVLSLLEANYHQGLNVRQVAHVYNWPRSKARARLNSLVLRDQAFAKPDQNDPRRKRYFYQDQSEPEFGAIFGNSRSVDQ